MTFFLLWFLVLNPKPSALMQFFFFLPYIVTELQGLPKAVLSVFWVMYEGYKLEYNEINRNVKASHVGAYFIQGKALWLCKSSLCCNFWSVYEVIWKDECLPQWVSSCHALLVELRKYIDLPSPGTFWIRVWTEDLYLEPLFTCVFIFSCHREKWQ
jgi:hypothetical protein